MNSELTESTENHPLFFLRDTRSDLGSHAMWWAKQGSYTSDIEKAAQFTAKKAQEQHNSRPSDVPYSTEYVTPFAKRGVDFQLTRTEPAIEEKKRPEVRYVLQRRGRFDGNDICWLAGIHQGKTKCSFLLDEAKIFTLKELEELEKNDSISFPWSDDKTSNSQWRAYDLNFISSIAAKRVAFEEIKTSKDHPRIDAGITIKKEKKIARDIYRCVGCGAFMSVTDYYGGTCKKCDTESQP